MKISFIATVFNEEKTVEKLLKSLCLQTKLPEEIIIVDGGSKDNTLALIFNFKFPVSKKNVKILKKLGNRSVGRNEAIKNANGDIVVCSDAGCVLDKNWIKNITAPFVHDNVDVVAGYYKGNAKSVFQKCVVPYVLVMPDKTDPDNFLPATRSVAFRKSIWQKAGGFPEKYSRNEDYVFARKLKRLGANIVFQKDAVVYWIPEKNIRQAFHMFLRHARGDAEARIFRPKVTFLFLRYFTGLLLLVLAYYLKSIVITFFIIMLFIFYLLWAIRKNYNYVKDRKALFILPVLQLTADFAVMTGTILGLINIWDIRKQQ